MAVSMGVCATFCNMFISIVSFKFVCWWVSMKICDWKPNSSPTFQADLLQVWFFYERYLVSWCLVSSYCLIITNFDKSEFLLNIVLSKSFSQYLLSAMLTEFEHFRLMLPRVQGRNDVLSIGFPCETPYNVSWSLFALVIVWKLLCELGLSFQIA